MTTSHETVDKFREVFKYYKSREPPPDFSEVIGINSHKNQNVLETVPLDTSCLDSSFPDFFTSDWSAFELKTCPGLIIIKNAFTPMGERYLAMKCLQDYPRHPNPTNLQTKHNLPLDIQHSWWEQVNQAIDSKAKTKLKNALRWTTLGYHHDWDSKVYDEKMKNVFPGDLEYIIKEIAKTIGFTEYQPEAAIVNYYPLNSTLAGHTDHSEYCKEPLFSISLGQSAIFLIGGINRDIKPRALLLESGDIVVMTKESRLSYHAIPKIIKVDTKSWSIGTDNQNNQNLTEKFHKELDEDILRFISDEERWKPFDEYLSQYRININVRQVHSNSNKLNIGTSQES